MLVCIYIFTLNVGKFPRSCMTECRCYSNSQRAILVANCSYSGLTHIPDSLPEQTDWLILSGNNNSSLMIETTSVNDTFYYVSELDLDGNNLANISSEIMDGFIQNKIILHLDISNNHLESLPKSFKNLTSLNTLKISGNIFECSCDNFWMKEWLLNETQVVMDFENVKCKMKSGKWIPVVHMDKTDMGCIPTRGDAFSIWNILGRILSLVSSFYYV